MMFNNHFVCFAFAIDEVPFVAPVAFLLHCRYLMEILYKQARERLDTLNALLHYAASNWLKRAAVTFLFMRIILNAELFVLALKPAPG